MKIIKLIMKRIIVPTDFSEGAWNAFLYAVKLAEKIDIKELIILNSYQEPHSGASTIVSIQKIMKEDSERQMEGLLERIKKSGLGVNFNIREKCIHGGLVQVLNSLIKAPGQAIIVMGTQGETGALEKLMGSNASDVATTVNCPVFIIPPQVNFSFSPKILLAAEFKKLPASLDKSLLKALTTEHPSERLEVVQVGNSDLSEDVHHGNLKELLKEIPYAAHIISGRDVVETLDEYISKSQPDLLVLIKMKMGLFKSIFHVSVTKKLTMHINIPLLILKGEES